MRAEHYEITIEVDEGFVNIIVGAHNKEEAKKEIKKELKKRKIILDGALGNDCIYPIYL